MLLVLMYHQIVNPNNPYGLAEFQEHLDYLKANFPIILPGEPLIKNKLNICLTFDDAYFDFYYYIFPLLQKLNLSAVLGIPTKLIQETTIVAPEIRLNVPYPHGMDTNMQHKTPLCTWQEIQEMVASGNIIPASHSHSHVFFTEQNINLTQELQLSQQILHDKLQTPINTLIYPFGQTTRATHKIVRNYYQYDMRIGSAINLNWESNDRPIYRMDAYHLWHKKQQITWHYLLKAKLKYWLNILCRK